MLKIISTNSERLNDLKAQIELETKKEKLISDFTAVAKKHGFESLDAALETIIQVSAPAKKRAEKDPNAPARERKLVTQDEINKVVECYETHQSNASLVAKTLGLKYPRVIAILKKYNKDKEAKA